MYVNYANVAKSTESAVASGILWCNESPAGETTVSLDLQQI